MDTPKFLGETGICPHPEKHLLGARNTCAFILLGLEGPPCASRSCSHQLQAGLARDTSPSLPEGRELEVKV